MALRGPQGGAPAIVQRGPQGGGPGVMQRGPRINPGWQGDNRGWHRSGRWAHGRKHVRPGPVFGFAGPYYYDYASPYVYEDPCWEIRYWRGAYRRFWVCD
jgi:hypothetical protein